MMLEENADDEWGDEEYASDKFQSGASGGGTRPGCVRR
jgi:hypothetical protein